jgi:hypothetical protein
MMKNFRPNKKGAYWCIHTHKTYLDPYEGEYEYVEFYPFPIVKCSYNGDPYDHEDYCFHIEFVWLCWEIMITRYWGKAYEKSNLKM